MLFQKCSNLFPRLGSGDGLRQGEQEVNAIIRRHTESYITVSQSCLTTRNTKTWKELRTDCAKSWESANPNPHWTHGKAKFNVHAKDCLNFPLLLKDDKVDPPHASSPAELVHWHWMMVPLTHTLSFSTYLSKGLISTRVCLQVRPCQRLSQIFPVQVQRLSVKLWRGIAKPFWAQY